jgi:site-specific DNA-methyltransferase (adenine-specific)
MRNEVYNIDCMEYMKTLPDKYFDICIADPPYGVSYARGKNGWGVCDNRPDLEDVKWDKEIPRKEFFDELLRVSDKVIIWGGNYFTHLLPVSKCWIVWDKCNGTTNKSVFADAELAWTNMTKVVKMFHLRQMGFISDTKDGKRIHPTQKPTELYEWLIKNYAKEGDIIFDPMMGSQSSRIAAHRLGFDYVGCELDKEYFDKGCERFKNETMQLSLF